ncbi:hypothetical protein [Candidatus Methylocalor cossyra]|uniref:Uncharacterized protein n=1 Tax=Candidatus Methylocalor cossyra TaxID=3108543 RepID=A0ABM9NMM6_9GAMM
MSPSALETIALTYNQATADVLSKQLLLNIARAKNNEPIHFSGIANIAATLNFQANMGVTPPQTGANGLALLPIFGVGAADNPTISMVPMQGEEFTRRMLTPLTEEQLILLLRQNLDVDMLLRLVTLEFRTQQDGREEVYHNRPRNREDYAMFRRVVLHLASIQERDALYVEPLEFEQHWTLPAGTPMPEGLQALEKGYSVRFDPVRKVYHLSKPVTGRVLIANYDPDHLPEEERVRLHTEAEQNAPNDLLVDIRPGYPGGEYPLHGRFRLRSFSNILYFIGRSLAAEPEFAVAKDPRTPAVARNPVAVLEITETDHPPPHTDLMVAYGGHYYAVGQDLRYPWNRTAFRVLWQLFQMTMAELPRGLVPGIAITK